ncbi:hypothetical protein TWF102_007885 [Orbilia oligospora]|uniref:Uncharacterized protein n=1 Tax=Orbilia oligospora TaxID=2813651 RepID=A0A7C8J6X5_ORBOL|nr:hypothetical protein TWF102_007885 [Orbilia oligospora]KAF3106267.1 hypothetical protein TWF103_006368 [Orbilia oligospora]KAF3111070.1 hypothetical protein TWF706_000508 [Orbilia oligospora]KAF3137800.1 hypothetical protein TWF594_007450 [Orbilia oligospora]
MVTAKIPTQQPIIIKHRKSCHSRELLENCVGPAPQPTDRKKIRVEIHFKVDWILYRRFLAFSNEAISCSSSFGYYYQHSVGYIIIENFKPSSLPSRQSSKTGQNPW